MSHSGEREPWKEEKPEPPPSPHPRISLFSPLRAAAAATVTSAQLAPLPGKVTQGERAEEDGGPGPRRRGD